jgi:malate dehydrogenase (oxaloacetate-decarboxylating)(NADP+)
MAGVKLSGIPVDEQRIVFMGAGSAGVGVAKQVLEYYTREPHNLSEEEAKKKFFLVDTKGLVTADRGDRLAEHKKYFARSDLGGKQCGTLEEVIEFVKPSALIGLAATGGIFTEEIVRSLTSNVTAGGATRRPILFPLSNPTTKAECTFAQAIEWTDGKAIFASGSPFPAYTPSTPIGEHTTYYPNQGNNVYVFPGLGMGAVLAKAEKVTDDMVYASAAALCDSLTQEEVDVGLIYPRIERVRQASVEVARSVMRMARQDKVEGVWRDEWEDDRKLEEWITTQVYDPLVGEVKL